jgi:FG-GAP repeat protein
MPNLFVRRIPSSITIVIILTFSVVSINAADLLHHYGYSVAGNSDVSNDGVPDLIVGSPGQDVSSLTGAGRVYIYSGDDDEGHLLYYYDGEESGDSLGYSTAFIGDVNNDGKNDFIIGAPFADSPGKADAGKVYVYSGETFELIIAFTGSNANDQLGRSVSGIGNINGDSYTDFIVGAPGSDLGKGRYNIYHGGATPSLHYSEPGENTDDSLGMCVWGGGDIDNNGTPDYVVGAPYWGPTDLGMVYPLSGSSPGTMLFSLVPHVGTSVNERYGWSVSGCYIDDNAYCDFIVGSPHNNDNTGMVCCYNGSTGALFFSLCQSGDVSGDLFGYSVAGDGDICDSDGKDDFIVGIPGETANRGKSSVFHHTTPAIVECSSYPGEFGGDRFGWSVASAGDVNSPSDNRNDVLIGAPYYDSEKGKAYVYSGLNSTELHSFTPRLPTVNITSPATDSIVLAECEYEITWNATNADLAPILTLFYSNDGGSNWGEWPEDIDNDGSFDWDVPLLNSTNCKIRLCTPEGYMCDTSDVFRIAEIRLNPLYPNSIAKVCGGCEAEIVWDTLNVDVCPEVDIRYNLNDGSGWQVIGNNVANDGSIIWNVPDEVIASANIELCHPDGCPCDTSAGFEIIEDCFNIVFPGIDDTLTGDCDTTISWIHNDNSLREVIIEFSSNNGGDWALVDTARTPLGNYRWRAPEINSEDCLLRIHGLDACWGDTSEVFTIENVNCCLAWGIPGDANKDINVNLTDILNAIQYVYIDPLGQPQAADGCNALYDVNGDGETVCAPTVNLTDILDMISYVYVWPPGSQDLCCPPGCLYP